MKSVKHVYFTAIAIITGIFFLSIRRKHKLKEKRVKKKIESFDENLGYAGEITYEPINNNSYIGSIKGCFDKKIIIDMHFPNAFQLGDDFIHKLNIKEVLNKNGKYFHKFANLLFVSN